MAELRLRAKPAAAEAEASASFDLASALKEVRRGAIDSGLSRADFDSCLAAVARDKGLHPAAPAPAAAARRGACVLALKALWVCVLVLGVLLLVAALHKPTGFLLQKAVHTRLYSFSRAVRFAALGLRPYLSVVGYDPFEKDCLFENPFLNASERCALLHVKRATELQLNSTHRTIPDSIFSSSPNEQVYVIRNAVDFTESSTLESVLAYPSQHEGKLPHLCLEIGMEEMHGLTLFKDLFNREKMKHYLQLEKPWTFSWHECPSPLHPETLLPPLSSPPLPLSVEQGSSSLYTAASQWAHVPLLQDLVAGPVLVLAVAVGEVRVRLDVVSESCAGASSTGFRSAPVLQAGDLMIFDSRFWMFHGSVWSPFALTMTTSLLHTNTG